MKPINDNPEKCKQEEELKKGLKKLKEKGDGEKFSPGADPDHNAEEFSTD
ncbi:hypothetical protein [Flavobacterium sp.]